MGLETQCVVVLRTLNAQRCKGKDKGREKHKRPFQGLTEEVVTLYIHTLYTF